MQRRRALRWLLGGSGGLALFGCGGGGDDRLDADKKRDASVNASSLAARTPPLDDLRYKLVDLASLIAGVRTSVGSAINEIGEVAGYAAVGAEPHAFVYRNGAMQILGSPGVVSVGRDIGDSGQVTGLAGSHAFLYSGGVMHDIGTLGGDYSEGWGVNASGHVVGEAGPGSGPRHAFLYRDGVMTDLGVLEGDSSIAMDINNAGQITGTSTVIETDPDLKHAFFHDGTSMHDLGTLGGMSSAGNAINSSGWVTGYAQMAVLTQLHAFLHDGLQMRDLGNLGGTFSVGLGINDTGWVVGQSDISTTPGTVRHAFVHDGTSLHDINNLLDPSSAGWLVEAALDINNAGQITGFAYPPGDPQVFRAVLLIPAPC